MSQGKRRVFSWLGEDYFFTHLFDCVSEYQFGCISYIGNKVKDNRSAWKRVAPGLYIKKKQ